VIEIDIMGGDKYKLKTYWKMQRNGQGAAGGWWTLHVYNNVTGARKRAIGPKWLRNTGLVDVIYNRKGVAIPPLYPT